MTRLAGGRPHRSVGVVVPARNEEDTIGTCLDGLHRAASALPADCAVTVVVVLDGCTDHTGDLVRAIGCGWAVSGHRTTLRALQTAGGNVGAARALGFSTLDRGALWWTTTDADSIVPDHWLAHQLAVAGAGADAWLGTVSLSGLYHPCATAWDLLDRSDHPHVHGANLGVSPAAYVACGGFAPLESGEDVDLAQRLADGGWRIMRGLGAPVTTSGRTVGRAPGGYAADRAADRAAGRAAPPDMIALRSASRVAFRR